MNDETKLVGNRKAYNRLRRTQSLRWIVHDKDGNRVDEHEYLSFNDAMNTAKKRIAEEEQ
ncbi:MAG: hypothetical protein OXE56_07145 [Gammaproteobacteria bacterium]|nr:hypothetical protein [Gammaproteobacteria bacterium]